VQCSGVMVGSFPTCLFCEGVIASDEPLIVVEHEGERKTSFAREPELAERGRGLFACSLRPAVANRG
jgi:hypothetical protein